MKLTVTVAHEGRTQHYVADHGAQQLAGILKANYPVLSVAGATALAQVAALGGRGELVGVSVVGASTDGARARCPHCGWEVELRRVQSYEDFTAYMRATNPTGFTDPRDVGKYQRGVPLYFPPGECELCGENLTLANRVQEGEA